MKPTHPHPPLPPKTPWYRRLMTSDRVIMAGGVSLAAFAAFFPWYVFLHQEEFGPKPMVYSRSEGLAQWPGRTLLDASPLVEDSPDSETSETFDPLMTATVPTQAAPAETDDSALDQPFPSSRSPFRLLHVANGRALIENGAGMYIVRIGSVLPDNSRLARLEKREGEWVIVTSDGDVIAR
ncbi:flagellar protein [Pararhizobium haloflavum]|uniref:flagellar protein n=1 Tax=Pararhizobium haloflavum TaxID=2037914 RepID=UPI000C186F55|nr:flagellar protein [Pararhizobium haloflavum]